MDAKEMYEALLKHLATVSEEDLKRDWDNLKEYNVGVSITEYIESLQYVVEVMSTPVCFANSELDGESTYKSDNSISLAA